jgi:hypothetical protein
MTNHVVLMGHDGHVTLKGKAKNRTPRSSETTRPGTTKFGTDYLMSHRGPNIKIGKDRLRRV